MKLHGRATRYEVVMVLAERELLIGYTASRSVRGLIRLMRDAAPAIADVTGLPDHAPVRQSDAVIGKPRELTLGEIVTVRFSGRTEHQAMWQGPLASVIDTALAQAAGAPAC